MTVVVKDKREWLAAKGMAKAGSRGRFSREALAEWDRAVAAGEVSLSPDASETPKVVKVAAARVTQSRQTVKAPDPKTYDTAKVRKWAQSQGIDVSPRGRIPADVVSRYLDEVGPEAAQEKPKPAPAVKYREQETAWGIARRKPTDGAWVTESAVHLSSCAACKKGIAYCAGHGESGLPLQPHYLSQTEKPEVPVMFEKPVIGKNS